LAENSFQFLELYRYTPDEIQFTSSGRSYRINEIDYFIPYEPYSDSIVFDLTEYSKITDIDSFPITHLFEKIPDIRVVPLKGQGFTFEAQRLEKYTVLCLEWVDLIPYKADDPFDIVVFGDVSSKAIPLGKFGFNINFSGSHAAAKVQLLASHRGIENAYLASIVVDLVGSLQVDTLTLNTNAKFSHIDVDISRRIVKSVYTEISNFSAQLPDDGFQFAYITNGSPSKIKLA
jgi:hypothetical protein